MGGISTLLNDPDKSLAIALQKGDRGALDALYDKYAPTLLGLLQKATGDTGLAEELLSTCFMLIWQNKQCYNSSKERFFTWIYRITGDEANKALVEKTGNTKNQSDRLYVSEGTSTKKEDFKIIQQIIFGCISQKEAAEKIGISVDELRKMVRKEINKARGIS
jgi:DNA-directed RNA polymerase specialized sigma24 family protein